MAQAVRVTGGADPPDLNFVYLRTDKTTLTNPITELVLCRHADGHWILARKVTDSSKQDDWSWLRTVNDIVADPTDPGVRWIPTRIAAHKEADRKKDEVQEASLTASAVRVVRITISEAQHQIEQERKRRDDLIERFSRAKVRKRG